MYAHELADDLGLRFSELRDLVETIPGMSSISPRSKLDDEVEKSVRELVRDLGPDAEDVEEDDFSEWFESQVYPSDPEPEPETPVTPSPSIPTPTESVSLPCHDGSVLVVPSSIASKIRAWLNSLPKQNGQSQYLFGGHNKIGKNGRMVTRVLSSHSRRAEFYE